MTQLADIAPAFVAIAHRIVWCTVATVAVDGRPRTRILHPIWEWDGTDLVGWIATGPTPLKVAHLEAHLVPRLGKVLRGKLLKRGGDIGDIHHRSITRCGRLE